MRNENLELAHSSGSDSSPSWASAAVTNRASEFNFDFGQSRIDDLSTQLRVSLRTTRSSEVLSQTSEDTSTPSSSSNQYLYGKSSSTIKQSTYGSGDLETSSSSVAGDRSYSKESKVAKFVRRTQSSSDDNSTSKTSGGESSQHQKDQNQPPEPVVVPKQEEAHENRIKKRLKLGTDMKFRLGFLKRRHTEGTIQSSVRPNPEEAQKWASSFNDLMASKYGVALFRAFLQREFSDENIEFWLAIEDYKKTRHSKLNSKAQKIYNDYIVPQAPKEVNLDSLTRDGLMSKLAQPNLTTFDQAQKRIQGLLESDAYLRFLKSDLYLELLHPEKYQT